MGPITSYKELPFLANDNEERWYLMLIMNPRNQTNAGIDVIKNFSYLNVRTGRVTLFLPGFSNTKEGIVPFCSHSQEIVYQDESFGEIYFDERGFLDTINWLEHGNSAYRYSEDLDLIIIKTRHRRLMGIWGIGMGRPDLDFDFHNMIVYNLDSLKREGINVIRMITECINAVSSSNNEREVRLHLENFIFSRSIPDRHRHQSINVFVAGSKDLKQERDAVTAALIHITNNSSRDYVFRIKTYEDFDRSLSEDGRQAEYNKYISEEAEYAIFILDNLVGGITFEEFIVAMTAFKESGRPEIYVYSRMLSKRLMSWGRQENARDVITIRKYLSEIGQYYIEYRDIDDLKNHIMQDFRRYGL